LCINFTNEKLQQQFIDALVKLQQEDYEREGLQCAHISFPDNSEQLQLLDARMGVMGMLDEECALPKGTEESYVEKMHKMFVGSTIYSKPARGGAATKRKSVLPSSVPQSRDVDKLQFCVQHYAGNVMYTSVNWLEKNRGFLQPDLAFLMSTSSDSLLQSLFPVSQKKKDDKKTSTLLATFRASLRALTATLLQTNARYIRCIKPNADKVPGRCDGHFMARQLRYTGVSAVVEIQRSGYPISLPKADFIARYRCCAFSFPDKMAKSLTPDVICSNLLDIIQELIGSEPGKWTKSMAAQMGKTKVFMREEVVKQLEAARDAVWAEGASGIQRAARARIAWRTVSLARTHKKLAVQLRAAIDKKALKEASQLLDEIKATWSKASVSVAAAPALRAAHREVAQLEVELQVLEDAEKSELEACESLKAALASKEFVALKVSLQIAQEASQGICTELTLLMAEAEAALAAETKRAQDAEVTAKSSSDSAAEEAAKKKIEEYKRWEAEVESKAKERMQARKAAMTAAQELDAGEGMESITVEVRNDPRPEKGIGIELNSMNTITAIFKGGLAAKDGKLKIGDIVTAVDGISVKGKKCVSAMDEIATSYKFTLSRYKAQAQAALHAGVHTEAEADMEGWLFQVKALDGRAVKLPKKRCAVCVCREAGFLEQSRRDPHAVLLTHAQVGRPAGHDAQLVRGRHQRHCG
jgi:myosin heavy subunit